VANRPDILIKTQKEKARIPIDATISANRNVVQKEAEKKINTKYNEYGT
jgi:hypothetical protein